MASDGDAAEGLGEGEEVLEDAFIDYRDAGLRLPPVPLDLVADLDEYGDFFYGSEKLDLFDRQGFHDSAMAAGGDRQIAFGHVGHGVNSWFLCYRLQLDSLAVYTRLPFGGVYNDDEAALPGLNAVAAKLESLITAAEAAAAAGRLAPGHRLVVALDMVEGSGWEVAGRGDGWHESLSPLDDAMALLAAPALEEDEQQA